MSTYISVVVFVNILFAVATYSVVKNQRGQPVGWTVGAFVAWPFLVPIAAVRYRCKPLLVSGMIANALLVICALILAINSRTARFERQSVTNLHELGQAFVEYTEQHGGQLPAKIEELMPFLRRPAIGSELPPALISPFSADPGLMGYQLVMPRSIMETPKSTGMTVQDLPADALIIKDIHAPADMRIGVYADGTVRSY